MHVRLADESVCIGPPPARDSYLNIPRCSPPARSPAPTPCIPGYGFLSENARFAEILAEHGITFIGPKAEHIRIMGDKIEAKRTAKRLGIPVVPGSTAASPRRGGARIAARSAFRCWSRRRPAAAGAA
jgi:acetyl-CoA carboxylase, biotin carboxylase subunit